MMAAGDGHPPFVKFGGIKTPHPGPFRATSRKWLNTEY